MVRPSILKIGNVWVKKASRKSGARCPKIFFNMRIKTGFKSTTFLTVQALKVDDTIKNLEKEGIPVQGRDHLMFLEDGVKSKEGRRQAVQEKTNLVLLFGDNLVDFADFSKTSEADRDKKLEELQKRI